MTGEVRRGQQMMKRTRTREIRGRHVLMALLGFFGLIVAVNGVFIYFAIDSWTGLTTEHAYVKGLAYNETLRAAETQERLGWNAAIDVAEGGEALVVRLTDEKGRALDDLDVSAELLRPTHEGYDREVALDFIGEGRYRTALDLPLEGQWDLRLFARRQGLPTFRVDQRLWVPQ